MKKPQSESQIFTWAESGQVAELTDGKQATGYVAGPQGAGEAPFYQHFNRKFQNLFRRAKESLLHQSQRDEIWGTQAQVQSANDRATLYWDGANFRDAEGTAVPLTGKKRILVRSIGPLSANLDLSALEVDLEMDGLAAALDLNGYTLTLGACSGELRVEDATATPGQVQIKGRANAIKILTDGNVTIQEVDGLFSGSYHLNGVLNSDRTQDLEARLTAQENTNWPYRNRIINGDCRIRQRGAINHADGNWHYGYVDRFRIKFDFASYNGGIYLDAGFPATSATGLNSVRIRPYQTASTVSNGNQLILIEQLIESCYIEDLSNQPVTFSCLVRHELTGSKTVKVMLSRANATNDFSSTTAIVTSPGFSVAPGTNTPITFTCNDLGDVSNGLAVTLIFEAAQNLDNTAQVLETTHWQLEPGTKATAFEFRPFTQELQLCQRYYCKTFNYSTPPANNQGWQGALLYAGWGLQTTGALVQPFVNWKYPVEMAKSPTITCYSPSSSNQGQWCNTDGNTSNVAAGTFSVGSNNVCIHMSNNVVTCGNLGIHAAADAEL